MEKQEFTWKPISRARVRRSKKSSQSWEGLPWMPMKARVRMRRQRKAEGEMGLEIEEEKIIRENYRDCGFCKGKGEYPPTFICPACKGRGELRIKPPAVVCPCCHGYGREKPRGQLTCLACRGKGVMTVKEPIEVCRKCRGKGKDRNNDTLLCLVCKGAGVVTKLDKSKRYMRRPSGTEWEVAEAVYYFGGEASLDEVAPRLKISTAYTEYVCKSMLDQNYLEQVSGRIYALTPECEKMIQEREEKIYAKVTDEEKEILRLIREKGEVILKEISQKLGRDIKKVRRLTVKMANRDMLDLKISGKYILGAKGEKVLQGEEKVDWR